MKTALVLYLHQRLQLSVTLVVCILIAVSLLDVCIKVVLFSDSMVTLWIHSPVC